MSLSLELVDHHQMGHQSCWKMLIRIKFMMYVLDSGLIVTGFGFTSLDLFNGDFTHMCIPNMRLIRHQYIELSLFFFLEQNWSLYFWMIEGTKGTKFQLVISYPCDGELISMLKRTFNFFFKRTLGQYYTKEKSWKWPSHSQLRLLHL